MSFREKFLNSMAESNLQQTMANDVPDEWSPNEPILPIAAT